MFKMSDLVQMFNEIFGADFFADVINILKLNPQSDSLTENTWIMSQKLNTQVVVPIAVSLLLIYFVVHFIQKAASEQCTFEQLFALFCKMVAAKFLIENGVTLMGYLLDIGVWFVNDILTISSYQTYNPDVEAIWKSLSSKPWNNGNPEEFDGFIDSLNGFGLWFKLVIPWIVAWVLKIVIKFVCYARILEIMLRTAMAPIAFADFFKEGTHGAGFRFLLNYLAVSLQGGFMVAIAILYSSMVAGVMNGVKGGFFDFVAIYFVISFACLGLLIKSGQLAKEIVHAQ